MLIYTNLGEGAETSFTQSWGIGYGAPPRCWRGNGAGAAGGAARADAPPAAPAMDNASEWRDIFTEAAKVSLILVILDLLRVSRDASWFEEHVDFVSMQAVLSACPASRLEPYACAGALTRAPPHTAVNCAARGWWSQTRTLVRLQARLTDD